MGEDAVRPGTWVSETMSYDHETGKVVVRLVERDTDEEFDVLEGDRHALAQLALRVLAARKDIEARLSGEMPPVADDDGGLGMWIAFWLAAIEGIEEGRGVRWTQETE